MTKLNLISAQPAIDPQTLFFLGTNFELLTDFFPKLRF